MAVLVTRLYLTLTGFPKVGGGGLHLAHLLWGGLLMLAAFRMVDYRQLLFHLRATRFDALIVLATALAAIFISVEFCIVIGVFLSFALYVPRAAQVPRAASRPGAWASAGCSRAACSSSKPRARRASRGQPGPAP